MIRGLSDFKDAAEAVQYVLLSIQSVATVIAIIVGGVWAYKNFIQKREKHPRVEVTHHIWHRVIPGGKALLFIDVSIANKGSVLLRLRTGQLRVYQVLPVPSEASRQISQNTLDSIPHKECDFDWTMLGYAHEAWDNEENEIEPNEIERMHYQFSICSQVRVILIKSDFPYFENGLFGSPARKRIIGLRHKLLGGWKLDTRKQLNWSLTTVHELIPEEDFS